jgi:hypothetical protein
MGIGPVKAVPKVLKQAGLSINDIGLIELNEALPRSHWVIELGLNPDIVNAKRANATPMHDVPNCLHHEMKGEQTIAPSHPTKNISVNHAFNAAITSINRL